MYTCTKFQSFCRFSDLGTKFTQKTFSGGVLGQMQSENNLFLVKNTIIWIDQGGFR